MRLESNNEIRAVKLPVIYFGGKLPVTYRRYDSSGHGVTMGGAVIQHHGGDLGYTDNTVQLSICREWFHMQQAYATTAATV